MTIRELLSLSVGQRIRWDLFGTNGVYREVVARGPGCVRIRWADGQLYDACPDEDADSLHEFAQWVDWVGSPPVIPSLPA